MQEKNRLYIILVSEFPPGQTGGIAHWAHNLFTTLRKSGHRVVVFTRRTARHDHSGPASEGPVFTIPGRNWNRLSWLYTAPRLLPLLIVNKNPVVIAATWRNAAKLHRLKKILRFTLFCSARGTDITKAIYPQGKKEQKQLRRVLKDTDLLIPISRFLDSLVKRTFPDLEIRSAIIGNDVDHRLFRPVDSQKKKNELRTKLGIAPETPLLLTVGRMVPFKGFPDLIEALPAVVDKVPDMKLLMVSSPRNPEYRKLQDAISRHGVEKHIIMHPPVEHEELPSIYQAADVFVLWSKAVFEPMYQEEGFGRTAIEAAACALPVIVSDTGGQPETVIDGRSGHIVPSGNKALLAERLVDLLTNHETAGRMGREGRHFVETTYTAEIMKNKILTLSS
ncbi:glycosyltransferase family 4 protein [Prosthecochloris sp. N3]|uniref:Glycosyltransferase family 4 protein n=1 Tax=Prosthecochloris ethylica TaxID=2743976 RepID=A0ABR9XS65_9CHLB|nr:glycosyltransferase family 4 protein [Prosthecochloris ethylica]MBF0586873.1 glycosyltransferase family 4 protein [Prosthecochloris ethylica]MBF0636779.1 glycosyltransferase family 4 protein [Prosthecochloris ethylica]NUK47995.1 glycosyltransferase family 4 protein [Prosthecochloris ethylica]